MAAIEQLVLAHGTRGMTRLARHLPPDYAARAAGALWGSPRVLVTTGFYVEGHPETDGPPGAFFLGRALAALGATVGYVAEQSVLEMLGEMAEKMWRPPSGRDTGTPYPENITNPYFIEFPIADAATSRALCDRIIANGQWSAAVAIERCGRTKSGHYRNMLGTDITSYTAQVDDLFSYPGIVTVGVGDGGNEIGMGSLSEFIPGELGITDPVETRVDQLVLATVSNWGAYGIAACLSRLAGRDLLPGEGEEARVLEMMVALGAVDGLTHRAEPSVDGFSLDVTSALVEALRREIG